MSAQRTKGITLQKKTPSQKKVSERVVRKNARATATSRVLTLLEHSKDARIKIPIVNKIVRTVAKPKVTALAVPSPYRFPLPRIESMSLMARIAGLCFVVTGSVLSLLTASTHTTAMLGVVSESQTASAQMSAHGDAGSVSEALSFSLSVPSDTLHAVAPITLSGTADRVELYARTNGASITLGAAKQTDTPSVWRYEWDTRTFQNGTYSLYAIFWKGNESHQESFDRSVTIENAIEVQEDVAERVSSEDSSTQSPTQTNGTPVTPDVTLSSTPTAPDTSPSSTIVAPTAPSVTLSLDGGNPLQGIVSMIVRVPNGQSVHVAVRQSETGALYHAGAATRVDDTSWRIQWNTTHVTDGSYRLIAYAHVDGIEYRSAEKRVTVENTDIGTTPAPAPDEPPADPDQPLEPDITLRLGTEGVLSAYVDTLVTVSNAHSVELYRQPLHSFAAFFLGKAQRAQDGGWLYRWDTRETPNGEYQLFTRVTTEYGTTDSAKIRVQVRNAAIQTFTPDQTHTIDTLTDVHTALIQPATTLVATSVPNTVYIEPIDSFVQNLDADVQTPVAEILREFRLRLDTEINQLAVALRSGDTLRVAEIRAAIEVLKNDILERIPTTNNEDLLDQVNDYLDLITEEFDSMTVRNTALLKERIGDSILNDSDKDGISDYDEIHLYQTNPFTADTDGDGFIDSVEITQGFNPHDVRSEALIAYESPQETGVVREDLLEVVSVSTLTFEREDADTQALFSGRGLPNSFVTLYIYSTPVIVTVKTDAEGNWNYMLDKDLEDGEHEIYVGITDNAGRLVAKSNPLPFVKTAEAYTGLGTNTLPVTDGESVPSLLNPAALLIASSILVVVLGLVLLLIGIFVRPNVEPRTLAPAS
jgi:hypothetical protein